MIEFIAARSENGKKLDRVLNCRYPTVPRNLLFKALRKRDVRQNGVRRSENFIVSEGDRICIYLTPPAHTAAAYSVIYEDTEILIVSKEQGIPVHSDGNGEMSLLDMVRKDFGGGCRLCHRIDRNTGGLVMIARSVETEKLLVDAFKQHKIKKYYTCIATGKMPSFASEGEQILTAWHFKDTKKSLAYIYDEKRTGTREIKTGYRVIKYDTEKDASHLIVRLYTGRTHQIRAHLAHIGHPLVGDGKYGVPDTKERYGLKYQALWASRLELEIPLELPELERYSQVQKNEAGFAVFTDPPHFR